MASEFDRKIVVLSWSGHHDVVSKISTTGIYGLHGHIGSLVSPSGSLTRYYLGINNISVFESLLFI